MPFTPDNAREAGRQGGRACFARHGRDHMAAIGRLGFQGLARRLGFAGGSRRRALTILLGRGKLLDRSPDPTAALEWANAVIDNLDPDNPSVPC